MFCLLYESQATAAFGPDDLFSIVEHSARNNARDELTGFLLYGNNRFLQYVEGEAAALDRLVDRLERDRRHSSIRIFHRCQIAQRAFPRWRMKRLASVDQALDEIVADANSAGLPQVIRSAVNGFLS